MIAVGSLCAHIYLIKEALGYYSDVLGFTTIRENELDMRVKIRGSGALGYNILWGHAPEKLYHSYMVFGNEQRIGALVKGEQYYVRVDAFNENGITEGKVSKI